MARNENLPHARQQSFWSWLKEFFLGPPEPAPTSKWTEAQARWQKEKLREELKQKWFTSQPTPSSTLPSGQATLPDIELDKCMQGAYLLNNNLFGQAAEILQQAVAEEPDNPWPVIMLRYAYSRLGRHQDALAEVQAGITRMPRDVSLKLALAHAHIAGDDRPAAEKVFNEILENRPDESEALNGLAELLLRRGRAEDALKLIDRLLTRLPQEFDAWANKAWAWIQLGRIDEAKALLHKCCNDWPDYSRFHAQLAELAETERDYQRAVTEFRAAIERDGLPARFMAQLAAACLKAGRDKEALEAVDKAVAFDKRPYVRMLRALALARLARVAEAEEELALLGAQPNRSAAHNAFFALGALANVCPVEKREEYCRRALAILDAARPLPKHALDDLETDKDLAALALMPEFKELLAKMRAEAK